MDNFDWLLVGLITVAWGLVVAFGVWWLEHNIDPVTYKKKKQ